MGSESAEGHDTAHAIDEIGEAAALELEFLKIEEQETITGFASSAVRYEWQESYGDVGPKVPELEAILFGDAKLRGSTGNEFMGLLTLPVSVESLGKAARIANFGDAGLHPAMLDNIELYGYKIPTPIQQYCIPAIIMGHDMLACAQTGSGKTAAYLIPTISKLMGKANELAAPRPTTESRYYQAEPLIVIIAPTRELTTQIFNESRRFCYRSKLRPCVVYGGVDIQSQRAELQKGCDVLIATPGRLYDIVERGHCLSLTRIKFTVIDEADLMMDMGFGPQLRKFLIRSDSGRDENSQIAMFSATYPPEIMRFAQQFLRQDFIKITIGRIGSTHNTITQRIFNVEQESKKHFLSKMLLDGPPSRTLIFANHRATVDMLDDYLFSLSFPCVSIHSQRTQAEREDSLRAFRSGRRPIMIATGVASRGLDIKNVMHVINYDLPPDIDEYVHRIGRTARIGNRGLATSFFNEYGAHPGRKLVELLVESEQEVPEFLERYKDSVGASTTQASGKLDALGHKNELSTAQMAGGSSFGVAVDESWDDVGLDNGVDAGVKLDDGVKVDDGGWGTATDSVGTATDSWGVGNADTESSW